MIDFVTTARRVVRLPQLPQRYRTARQLIDLVVAAGDAGVAADELAQRLYPLPAGASARLQQSVRARLNRQLQRARVLLREHGGDPDVRWLWIGSDWRRDQTRIVRLVGQGEAAS